MTLLVAHQASNADNSQVNSPPFKTPLRGSAKGTITRSPCIYLKVGLHPDADTFSREVMANSRAVNRLISSMETGLMLTPQIATRLGQ